MLYKGTLQIVPNPINTYKYITGTQNKGQLLKRVKRGKGVGLGGKGVVLGGERVWLRGESGRVRGKDRA